MQIFFVILLMMLASFTGGDEPKRTLAIENHSSQPDKSFTAGEHISVSVVLHALSVEDRVQFEALVVDDWRYDTPNYFADRRSPNVVLHVERFVESHWDAVGFRASSQGGGSGLKDSEVEVDIAVGGDELLLQKQQLQIFQRADREKLPENETKKLMLKAQELYAPNNPGRYRISATYTGLFKKSGRLLLTTGPVEVVVKDAKPNTVSKSGNHVGSLPALDAAQLKIIRKLVVDLRKALPEKLLSLKAGTAHDEVAHTILGIQQIYSSEATQKLFVVLEIPTPNIEQMVRANDSSIQTIKSGLPKSDNPMTEQEHLMLQGFAAQLQCRGYFAARPQLTAYLSNGATITISAMADISRNDFDKFVDALPIRTIDQVISSNSLKEKKR